MAEEKGGNDGKRCQRFFFSNIFIFALPNKNILV